MTNSTPTLADLGDQLERSTERDLRRGSRHVGRWIGVAVAALFVVGAGTAVATGLFTPRQVAAGMPAGAAIFAGTHPTCLLADDGTTYHCTLDTVPAPEVSDFTGTKELLTVNGVISGGCIGQDTAGLSWFCYIGDDAVNHDILVKDLLGQPAPEPGRG